MTDKQKELDIEIIDVTNDEPEKIEADFIMKLATSKTQKKTREIHFNIEVTTLSIEKDEFI